MFQKDIICLEQLNHLLECISYFFPLFFKMNTVKSLGIFLQIKAEFLNSLLTGDPSEGIVILIKIVYIEHLGFYTCSCSVVIVQRHLIFILHPSIVRV